MREALKKPNVSQARADVGATLRAVLAPNTRIPTLVSAYARMVGPLRQARDARPVIRIIYAAGVEPLQEGHHAA
jgi:hypothetical protein